MYVPVFSVPKECFLAPELRAVLADLDHLVGLAVELRGALAGPARQLQACEEAASADRAEGEDEEASEPAPAWAGPRRGIEGVDLAAAGVEVRKNDRSTPFFETKTMVAIRGPQSAQNSNI